MGIDIFARWHGQSADERDEQRRAWLSIDAGGVGYLREAYHGEPYPSRFLCAEAFEAGQAAIAASLLRKRLPRTLELVEEREREVYKADAKAIAAAKQSYAGFCQRPRRFDPLSPV